MWLSSPKLADTLIRKVGAYSSLWLPLLPPGQLITARIGHLRSLQVHLGKVLQRHQLHQTCIGHAQESDLDWPLPQASWSADYSEPRRNLAQVTDPLPGEAREYDARLGHRSGRAR